ncbi:MAG: hypothetical protein QOE70_2064 [Chthoniobacter sp.]|jgi:antitoxin component YwqK of YwqJK toxin-antitoxin module|nr:hypothetical protein [Chthoniobacter sp.]
MKLSRICARLLWLVSFTCLFSQSDDDYLDYRIPPDATKLGPISTRNPNQEWFNYILPSAQSSRKSLVARETYEGGQLVERALYKNGVAHGVQRRWYRNGHLASEAPYKDGVMHGVFRHWSESAQLVGQYEIKNGTGTRKIYNITGELVHDEAILSSKMDGLQMELLPDGARSLIWERHGQIIGKTFCFNPNESLRSLRCFSAEGSPHGPSIDFSTSGRVTTKQWFVNNEEVSESQYAAAASADSTLPRYYPDGVKYKEFIDADLKALLRKYRTLPRVKIPLEFDEKGNLIFAQQ